MAFESLSDRLNHIFTKLRDKNRLSELEIKQAMREVRIALLEADVNLNVAKDFIARVSEKAVGENILKSLSPVQQVIKIVNEELVALMGGEHKKLGTNPKPPTVILMCGLQGSGKTTMCGKLAYMLKSQSKRPMLVACDIYRPAAIDQLKVVGTKAGVPVFEKGQIAPLKIAKAAIEEAKRQGLDTVIVDTAGRLHIDSELMKELVELRDFLQPTETLLVVDAMTGQDAVNVAEQFNAKVDITGVILTKLDGDTRGGAALSIRAVTGKPIKYSGTGEKVSDLEPFHPERMASRILGMGDVLTLIEKAEQAFTEEEAKKLQEKMREQSFTLNDFLDQFEKLKQMGNMTDLMKMIPGMSGMAGRMKGLDKGVDEARIAKFKAIIQSMTEDERTYPDIIKASRRKRIAAGSGTSIQDVNMLLKQFEQTKDMMRSLTKKGRKGGFGGLPF